MFGFLVLSALIIYQKKKKKYSVLWPVGFDHNREIVVWEEDEDDYWDGLPLDWAMDGDFGEEALAIRDAMEEEFQFFARQKSKGKRELLNLHRSINYSDANYPSRRRKGKAHML
jgi:hypothetical protein